MITSQGNEMLWGILVLVAFHDFSFFFFLSFFLSSSSISLQRSQRGRIDSIDGCHVICPYNFYEYNQPFHFMNHHHGHGKAKCRTANGDT